MCVSVGCIIVVDPPSLFWGLYKIAHPILARKTAAKVMFFDSRKSDADALRDLHTYFDEEMAQFILQQCRSDSAS